jgi:hypothetical protein
LTKEAITLLCHDGIGRFKVEVPAGHTITFGPFSPPGPRGYASGGSAIGTLRIYLGSKTNGAGPVAVFTGVYGYREIGMKVEREVISESGSHVWSSDEEGSSEGRAVKRSKKWVGDGPPPGADF